MFDFDKPVFLPEAKDLPPEENAQYRYLLSYRVIPDQSNWLVKPNEKKLYLYLVYTQKLEIQAIWYWLAISDYDVIFTALGGEYKA